MIGEERIELCNETEPFGNGGVHLSEGRGQNNQQPTTNDNNKRVVVFLCSSGI